MKMAVLTRKQLEKLSKGRMRENTDQNNSKYGHFSLVRTQIKQELNMFVTSRRH